MLIEKYKHLLSILSNYNRCAIAVSGGLDSLFLATTAQRLLGSNMMAISISTPYMQKSEQEYMIKQLKKHEIKYDILTIGTPINIRFNPENRCYLCKSHLFEKILKLGHLKGFKTIMDGTNADDMQLHRPGLKALKNLDIKSPLKEADLTKNEIRQLANLLGYDFYNRDSNSCLLTRLPYNYPVILSELRMIEKAEDYLINLHFNEIRVRSNHESGCIEVRPEQIYRMKTHLSNPLTEKYFKALGFNNIKINDVGYLTGKHI